MMDAVLPPFPVLPSLMVAQYDIPTAPPPTSQPSRPPGACKRCKRLKMKCVFDADHGACRRCAASERSCEVERRAPALQHASRHRLQDQLRARDELLGALLRQMHAPAAHPEPETPDPAPVRRTASPAVQVETSYNAGTDAKISAWPPEVEVLQRGIVSPGAVGRFFAVYFECMHPCLPILDPATHTPRRVLAKSTFLFTVICAIASGSDAAFACAQRAAAAALIGAEKSPDTAYAYMLLAELSPPTQTWAADRTALYRALAAQIIAELGLPSPTHPFLAARAELGRLSERFKDVLRQGSGDLAALGVFEDALAMFEEEWIPRLRSGNTYQTRAIAYLVEYSRLQLRSLALRRAVRAKSADRDVSLLAQQSCSAAQAVLTHFTDNLSPTGFLPYVPRSHIAPVAHAAAALLKLTAMRDAGEIPSLHIPPSGGITVLDGLGGIFAPYYARLLEGAEEAAGRVVDRRDPMFGELWG